MAVPAAAAQATKATTAASSVAKGANLASGIEAGGEKLPTVVNVPVLT